MARRGHVGERITGRVRPAAMPGVSVVSGEVNRTWRFNDASGAQHEVSLYHHPLTGARAAMLDYEELDGSLGTSSIFHGPVTELPFTVPGPGGERGVISIRHDGMLGFT